MSKGKKSLLYTLLALVLGVGTLYYYQYYNALITAETSANTSPASKKIFSNGNKDKDNSTSSTQTSAYTQEELDLMLKQYVNPAFSISLPDSCKYHTDYGLEDINGLELGKTMSKIECEDVNLDFTITFLAKGVYCAEFLGDTNCGSKGNNWLEVFLDSWHMTTSDFNSREEILLQNDTKAIKFTKNGSRNEPKDQQKAALYFYYNPTKTAALTFTVDYDKGSTYDPVMVKILNSIAFK